MATREVANTYSGGRLHDAGVTDTTAAAADLCGGSTDTVHEKATAAARPVWSRRALKWARWCAFVF